MSDEKTRHMPLFSSIEDFQAQVAEWNDLQPWRDDPPAIVALGLAEEAGEVCRAALKQHQGIRGTHDEWTLEAMKECGDVFIKMAALADAMGFNLREAIDTRWGEISQRNFSVDPIGHGLPQDG